MARMTEREKQLELALHNKTEASLLVQQIISVGLKALSGRILTTIALMGDVVFFVWVMAVPTWERLLGAVLFAIASYCVVNVKPIEKQEDS